MQKQWAGARESREATKQGTHCSWLCCLSAALPAPEPLLLPRAVQPRQQPALLLLSQPYVTGDDPQGDAQGSPAPLQAQQLEQAGLVLTGSPWAHARCLWATRSGV